jgi:hypothetical protein
MANTTIDLQGLFEELKNDWKQRSKYLSNSAQIASVRSYQRIIGLGPAVLPLILNELQRETDHWLWALEAISGENPVTADIAGKIQEMANAWIQWGKEKGII